MFKTNRHRHQNLFSALCVALMVLFVPVAGFSQLNGVSTPKEKENAVVAGLSVFGEVLGIHGPDTLTVWGDLVLDKAHVSGSGTLAMRGNRPTRIVSHQSSLQRLHIANSAKVTLHGDLRVDQRLTVESGVLDARPGMLFLNGPEKVQLIQANKLIVQPYKKTTAMNERSHHHLTHPMYGALALPVRIVWLGKNGRNLWKRADHEPFQSGPTPEKTSPPPESRIA